MKCFSIHVFRYEQLLADRSSSKIEKGISLISAPNMLKIESSFTGLQRLLLYKSIIMR